MGNIHKYMDWLIIVVVAVVVGSLLIHVVCTVLKTVEAICF